MSYQEVTYRDRGADQPFPSIFFPFLFDLLILVIQNHACLTIQSTLGIPGGNFGKLTFKSMMILAYPP